MYRSIAYRSIPGHFVVPLRSALLTAGLFMASVVTSPVVYGCGGFFCQNAPIDQAGEQIVFRQQGSDITAMVRILYTGEAEEFSWVVPVPPSIQPEGLSVGSDTTFNELDFQTRPQFLLEQRGFGCGFGTTGDGGNTGGAFPTASVAESADSDGGVVVQDVAVGPFDAQIVSSDNPAELATWLVDNGYDLTDRGEELIEPYVTAGMKFVALKLQSGATSGSILPLIMRYQSEKPMVPIRLTAIAAQDDMGVLVYVVGDARAIPENYPHVTPNYTRLNWYTGSFNAYSSYQGLITEAMNEAGGQGFATDYAGFIGGAVTASLTNGDGVLQRLQQFDSVGNNAEYLATVMANVFSLGQSQEGLLSFYRSVLPAPEGFGDDGYFNQFALEGLFTAQQLAEARVAVREFIVARSVDPLNEGIALLPEGAYLSRLYTTLSADEMTLDPVFAYNTGMPEQPVNREAVMDVSCGDNGTEWRLTLGAGTGRDGEVVIEAGGEVPFAAPDAVTTQRSVFQVETTSASEPPVLVTQNDFGVLAIAADGSVINNGSTNENVNPIDAVDAVDSVTGDDDDDGFLGASGGWLLLIMSLYAGLRRSKKPLL